MTCSKCRKLEAYAKEQRERAEEAEEALHQAEERLAEDSAVSPDVLESLWFRFRLTFQESRFLGFLMSKRPKSLATYEAIADQINESMSRDTARQIKCSITRKIGSAEVDAQICAANRLGYYLTEASHAALWRAIDQPGGSQ